MVESMPFNDSSFRGLYICHRVARWFGLAVALMFVGVLASAPAHASEGADDQKAATERVDNLHGELVAIMKKSSELGLEGRYEQLLTIVEEHFDVALIARIALGRHWAKLSKDERHQYVARLRQLIAARYADRLGDFNGQEFETLESDATASDRIAVKSQLTTADNDTVSLHYRLFLRDEQWRIYDVVSKGVSDLSMMRSQFSQAYEDAGFAELINTLDERISKYRGETDKASS